MIKSFAVASSMVRMALVPFLRRVEGSIPDYPCLFAANHSSFIDGPLLACMYSFRHHRPLHMIAYDRPFSHWLFGWILRSGRCIPFQNGSRESRDRMLSEALGWLAAGESVGLFPEGHINQSGRMGSMRPGMALLALESAVPVLPVGIVGSAESFPVGSRCPNVGRRIVLRFGEPVHFMGESARYHNSGPVERRRIIAGVNGRIADELSVLSGKHVRRRPDIVLDSAEA